MTQFEGYGEKRKFIESLLTHTFIPLDDICVQAMSENEVFKISVVKNALTQMLKKSRIDGKKISNKWNYRLLSEKLSSSAELNQATSIVKSDIKPKLKSVRIRTHEFLCTIIGDSISASDVTKCLEITGNNNGVYDSLKLYEKLGYLKLVGKSPLKYKVLPEIVPARERPLTKINKPRANNNEVNLINLQTESIEAPTLPLPDFQNLNMGDTINSIIQLQQQVGVYKQALEHIASILAQAGIIEE